VTNDEKQTTKRVANLAQSVFGEQTMRKAQQIFLKEVEQRVPQSQTALALLAKNGFDREAWDTLYKFAHTVKGSGKMVELWNMAESAAEMSTALLLIKDYGVTLSAEVQGYLQERLAEIVAELTTAYELSTVETVPDSPAIGGQRILIVDDDPAVTELLKENLEQNGYQVTVCHDTYAAEESLAVEQPDLIVLDIIFPCGDGIEFCRRIRSNPQWAIVPVIFLSVKGELHDKLAGFSTGADDYLCKPFKVEELVARVRAILNRLANCRELVLQDELTRVFNRRYLQMCLVKEISQAKRRGSSFSLAMLDVDHFKKVNDRFGHLVGDEILQCLVDKLVQNLRDADVVCRYGGDEFVILMPETSLLKACKILERVRQLIVAEPFKLSKKQMAITLTFSAGVAAFPQGGVTGEKLLKATDRALYWAKAAGRNNVKPYTEGGLRTVPWK
jgi:two-component system cell cycle response regulator